MTPTFVFRNEDSPHSSLRLPSSPHPHDFPAEKIAEPMVQVLGNTVTGTDCVFQARQVGGRCLQILDKVQQVTRQQSVFRNVILLYQRTASAGVGFDASTTSPPTSSVGRSCVCNPPA